VPKRAQMTAGEIAAANEQLAGKTPEQILAWANERFGDECTMASSFGGSSGTALLDMARRVWPGLVVFYLDTDYLFPETLEYKDHIASRFGLKIVGFKSRWTPEQQAKEFGPELWKRDPDLCCSLRKVEPNGRALEGYLAWITGIRRDQAKTRQAVGFVEWDAQFEAVKINPLAEWTESQVWDYIREHRLVYNRLMDRGYKSIGCTNCTRPVKDGEDPRAGRWAGTGKVECGIQTGSETIMLLSKKG